MNTIDENLASPQKRGHSTFFLPLLAAAAVTVAVELGVFFAAIGGGVSRGNAALACLAVSIVWIILACPAVCTAFQKPLAALLCGVAVADASAVALVVLYFMCPQVSFPAAMKIYCIYAAVALACIAAVNCARTHAGKFVVATGIAAMLMFILAGPFWIGVLADVPRQIKPAFVTSAVYANPFYCIWSAIVENLPLAWHQMPVMYRFTYMGSHIAPPPVPWYAAVIIYSAIAATFTATNLLRPLNRTFK